MLRFFRQQKDRSKDQSDALYRMIVRQVRSEWFYRDVKIEDTPFGRFEIMTIHLFMILRRLKEEKSYEAQKMAQEISDAFVVDLDHSLRDLRISETKLAKQFNKFIQGFYGRLIAYDKGLETSQADLNEAIHKNLFDGEAGKETEIALISFYIIDQLHFLKKQPITALQFKDIS